MFRAAHPLAPENAFESYVFPNFCLWFFNLILDSIPFFPPFFLFFSSFSFSFFSFFFSFLDTKYNPTGTPPEPIGQGKFGAKILLLNAPRAFHSKRFNLEMNAGGVLFF